MEKRKTQIAFFLSFFRKILFLFFFLIFNFCLFRATPSAYGSSQARGWMGAIAAGLHRSHSNTGAEPHLQPTPQLTAMPVLKPLSEVRDQTRVLMNASQFCFHWATTETPGSDCFLGPNNNTNFKSKQHKWFSDHPPVMHLRLNASASKTLSH